MIGAMKFGDLEMDPVRNPAILDTATWDYAAVREAVITTGAGWLAVKETAANGAGFPVNKGVISYPGSYVKRGNRSFFLAGLRDGQQVLVEIGVGNPAPVLGEVLERVPLGNGEDATVYPAHAAVIDRFCRILNPANAPRVLGQISRLGIGVRMTTAVWPGIFEAMKGKKFAANTIQNSVRELNLLDNLLAGNPPVKNYACGFGTIETGYTGSTFEGLWVAGVLAALRHGEPILYGADADHIQIKRDDHDLTWPKRIIAAARYYTFYTLDMSDVLNYQAVRDDSFAESYLAKRVPSAAVRRDLLAWHGRECRVGGRNYGPDDASVMRFAAKYWDALDAFANLREYISRLKEGRPFDLELSIDEHPPEVAAFDCLTTEEETLFVLREIKRRGLSITHIAPNFGIEKGWDYRHPSGLDGLYCRVRAQHRLSEEFGVMLDFHSADDLGPEVRAVLRRATGGRLHYKISPSLQLLFAEVLQDFHPDLFRRWWQDALAYALREAEAGSPFAAECLSAYEAAADQVPSPRQMVFHHYSFAFVGRRDNRGQFLYRQEFYSLSSEFYRYYQKKVADRLCQLAEELF